MACEAVSDTSKGVDKAFFKSTSKVELQSIRFRSPEYSAKSIISLAINSPSASGSVQI